MKLRDTVWALAVALVICGTAVHAQDQKQDAQPANASAPIPPIDSGLGGAYAQPPAAAARGVSEDYGSQPYDPSQVTPDSNTLAGAQLFGVGSLGQGRDIFDPSLSLSQLGQALPGTDGQTNTMSETIFGGNLNFNRTWSRYHFTTIYNGGGTLDRGYLSSLLQFHELTVTQQIVWNRWNLLLRDDFVASPGASFTGTGMGGPGLAAQFSSSLGSSLSSIGQSFIPSETIETEYAMRYRNSILGQAEYSLSRRSVFTVAASYGLLHFTDAGYISSQMLTAQAGYDYSLDPSDSVAIIGSYGNIEYTGTTSSTTNYMAALAFGRKITGRLAFQVGGGPQQIRSVTGSGGFQLWYAAANSALTYERRRSGYSLTFMRGLTAGSGVLYGAESNTVTGAAHYRFTRFWTGSVNVGYAINNSLAPPGTATVTFDDWFIGANLGRQLGPHALVNFSYGLQRQNNPAVCPLTSCGVNGSQQTFGMTVNWHLRPAG